jgi:hypothetical protein
MKKNEKPKINLVNLAKTAIQTSTEEDYLKLMMVYECGGRKWGSRFLPTDNNVWYEYGIQTCVNVDCRNRRLYYSSKDYYQNKGYRLISPRTFYRIQKINSKQILQINRWFDQHAIK